jgi:hypothetical protein
LGLVDNLKVIFGDFMAMLWWFYGKRLPVVPQKAVVEVSNIGHYRRGELLWCMDEIQVNVLWNRRSTTPRFSPCGFCFLGESHPQMWNISILDPKKMHRYNTKPGFLGGYWMLRVIQYSGKTRRNVRGAGLMLIWVYFKGFWL